MTTYSIDRIEEGIAVCESAEGETVRVRAETLPDGAKEGSLVSFSDGQWTLLEDETAKARHEMFLLSESLFDE